MRIVDLSEHPEKYKKHPCFKQQGASKALFATRRIRKGEFVCGYGGELLHESMRAPPAANGYTAPGCFTPLIASNLGVSAPAHPCPLCS